MRSMVSFLKLVNNVCLLEVQNGVENSKLQKLMLKIIKCKSSKTYHFQMMAIRNKCKHM